MSKPLCKQCLEGRPINPETGDPFPGPDNVVRFMGTWACKVHSQVGNPTTGENEWVLGDLFPNRHSRRVFRRAARGKAQA